MSLPSSNDMGAVNLLLENDPVFREKMDVATAIADKIGMEALIEIHAAQLSLQRLSDGGYPSEMEVVIKDKARETFYRYAKFLGALSSLKEPRLSRSYGPGKSPIHSLPPEMLSSVFSLTTATPLKMSEKQWRPSTLRLVCRDWKELAEETPTLWRNIDAADGLECSKRAVTWSKAVSLDVCLTGWSRGPVANFDECAQVALSELPRIRKLKITTYGTDYLTDLANLLALRPAPWLIDFEFAGEEDSNSDDVVVLHRDTFTAEVPARLRILNVRWTKIHTSCPVFHAPLTTLTLEFCTIWQNVDELLQTLTGLSMLEHLVLKTSNDVPQIDISAVHDFRPRAVKLLNLKSLHIQEDIKALLVLFMYLDIPNAARVLLAADYEDIYLLSQSNVLSSMSEVFGSYINRVFGDNATPPDAFTSLAITHFPGGYGDGYSAVFSKPAIDRNGLIEFSLGFHNDPEFVDEFKALLIRTLSWTPMNYRITHLSAIDDLDFLDDDETWAQIMEGLQNLEEVLVSGSAPSFIESLSKRGPEAVRPLRKLVFQKATLPDDMIDALTALLAARHGLGYPPMALSFIACHIAGEALDKLEGTLGVGEVYVHMDPRKTPAVNAKAA